MWKQETTGVFNNNNIELLDGTVLTEGPLLGFIKEVESLLRTENYNEYYNLSDRMKKRLSKDEYELLYGIWMPKSNEHMIDRILLLEVLCGEPD